MPVSAMQPKPVAARTGIAGAAPALAVYAGAAPGEPPSLLISDAASGKSAPFVGGIAAILGVFLVAGFSFQGTEGVGLLHQATFWWCVAAVAVTGVLSQIVPLLAGGEKPKAEASAKPAFVCPPDYLCRPKPKPGDPRAADPV